MMKHPIRATFHLALLLSASLALLTGVSQARTAQDGKPLYYASVKADGVVVRNLMDAKGLPMTELQGGDIVAVYEDETTGWLEVEIPTGYAAYVFGRFLEPMGNTKVHRVTRNAINIRPRPADDVTSFPLPQRLHAGDQVVVIGQSDPDKPIAEDWVRIWTPPGVRAFVRAEHVLKLNAAEGQSAWAKASGEIAAVRRDFLAGRTSRLGSSGAPGVNSDSAANAGERPGTKPGTKIDSTVTGELAAAVSGSDASAEEAVAVQAEARAVLRQLRRRIDAEKNKTTPDYGTLQSELTALMVGSSDASFQAEVARDLDRVKAMAESAAMLQELERIKEQNDQETARAQNSIWERGQGSDPLGHSFDVRGVLVRRESADGTPRYTVEVRRQVVAEILCTTLRYDLDIFSGYEVGLKGRGIAAEAAHADSANEVNVPILDVARIAVLRRR